MEALIHSHAMGNVVRSGLRQKQKSLPSWLFYDEAGSILFERITTLPEYYLTRMERMLLCRYASAILDHVDRGRSLTVLELGAGSARKTALLLRAALPDKRDVSYQPIDISAQSLEDAALHLAEELPALRVQPVLRDFSETPHPASVRLHDDARGQQMLLWLGSSAGNYEQQEAVRILTAAAAGMEKGDHLLIGLDMAPRADGKRTHHLLEAYNDAAGVTAEFNRNLLVRLNRELGAEFRLEQFEHSAHWNAAASRMEMHLVSTVAQSVRIEALEESFFFQRGEFIHTENSQKYTRENGHALLCAAGFPVVAEWHDPDVWYGLFLGERS